MSLPLWTLLGFSAWTLALLVAFVGVYRWFNILFRHAGVASFRSDQLEGEDWYRRGTRAHANCVENLPVFGTIVFVITVMHIDTTAVNYLCVAVLIARIGQSLIHVSHVQTDVFVAVRFSFFSVQLIAFIALIAIAATQGFTPA